MDLGFLVYKAGVSMGDGHCLCQLGQSMEWLWPGALWQHSHPEHCEWRCHMQDFLGNLISDVLSHVPLKCSKMPNTSAWKPQL